MTIIFFQVWHNLLGVLVADNPFAKVSRICERRHRHIPNWPAQAVLDDAYVGHG
jgi:hypothetical protein